MGHDLLSAAVKMTEMDTVIMDMGVQAHALLYSLHLPNYLLKLKGQCEPYRVGKPKERARTNLRFTSWSA